MESVGQKLTRRSDASAPGIDLGVFVLGDFTRRGAMELAERRRSRLALENDQRIGHLGRTLRRHRNRGGGAIDHAQRYWTLGLSARSAQRYPAALRRAGGYVGRRYRGGAGAGGEIIGRQAEARPTRQSSGRPSGSKNKWSCLSGA